MYIYIYTHIHTPYTKQAWTRVRRALVDAAGRRVPLFLNAIIIICITIFITIIVIIIIIIITIIIMIMIMIMITIIITVDCYHCYYY